MTAPPPSTTTFAKSAFAPQGWRATARAARCASCHFDGAHPSIRRRGARLPVLGF